VDNIYTSVNLGHEDDFGTADPKNVELKDISESKPEGTNGVHSNPIKSGQYNNNPAKPSADSPVKSPFLPKIFIALLIVLLIAVIALCFVLYHLDQQVTKTDTKVDKVDKDSKKGFKELAAKISEPKKFFSELLRNFTELEKRLKKIESESVGGSKKSKDQAAKLTNLTKNVSTLQQELKLDGDELSKLTQEITEAVGNNSDLKNYAHQLNMKMQLKELKLNLTIKKIANLAGIEDKVSKLEPVLHKLNEQKASFETSKDKWNDTVTYNDIMRLTSKSDFKNDKLPVVEKIGVLYTTFTSKYKVRWGITFKDIIKLTNNTDLDDVIIKDSRYGKEPAILLKIERLHHLFTEKYEKLWHIKFPDVFHLTNNLDFKVTDDHIPVLNQISGWYMENFIEIWGKSFESLLHQLIKLDEKTRDEYVEKLKVVAKENTLNFLPGKFEMNENKKLSVTGYIKILVDSVWGTIYNNATLKFNRNAANVVCKHGHYASGTHNGFATPPSSFDRKGLICRVPWLTCYGEEKNITICKHGVFGLSNSTWDHVNDVAVKCIL